MSKFQSNHFLSFYIMWANNKRHSREFMFLKMPLCRTHEAFPSVGRAARRVSCHQLVSGAGNRPRQPSVCVVESYGWRLSVGFGFTGDLGNLRQGLGSPQDPPWQPTWLLPLVRASMASSVLEICLSFSNSEHLWCSFDSVWALHNRSEIPSVVIKM